MKNWRSLACAIAVCLCLTACGHTHTWQDATCTAPRTCTECGETEGEPLAHTWRDADCTAPKTCSACAATEGEALGHTWTEATCAAPKTCSVCAATEGEALPHTLSEANYQSPAVCSVCDEAVGDPLTAAFESGEVDTSNFQPAELGVTYDYHTVAYDDHSVQQTNHVTFENYRVVPSDDTHEAKEGYEWHIVQLHFLSDDSTVGSLGWTAITAQFDYYSGSYMGDTFTVNYNGVEYECQQTMSAEDKWINNSSANDCVAELAIQVPAGYDGIIAAVRETFSAEEFDLAAAAEEEDLASHSGCTLRYMRLGA